MQVGRLVAFVSQRADEIDEVRAEFLDVELGQMQVHLAGFDLRQVQKIVDNLE